MRDKAAIDALIEMSASISKKDARTMYATHIAEAAFVARCFSTAEICRHGAQSVSVIARAFILE